MPLSLLAHLPGRTPTLAVALLSTLLMGWHGASRMGVDELFVRSPQAVGPREGAPRRNYGEQPLGFEANEGQTHPEVKFLARGSRYSLFLTPSESVFVLTTSDRRRAPVDPSGAESVESPPVVLRMQLSSSTQPVEVKGLGPLPGKANYFMGRDPKSWRTGISIYSKVRYEDVYPGVDLVYHGDADGLEYDFVVAPGSDPGVIGVRFIGAERAQLDVNGDLLIRIGHSSTLRQLQPFVYQELGGVRREIDGAYVIRANGEIGFRVGEYDSRLPLVIDPVLIYSTYLGGTDRDPAFDVLNVAVDVSGNAYVTGATVSADFPTTADAFQRVNGGGRPQGCVNCDGFITKLDASGTVVYSTYLGGRDGATVPSDVAVDSLGNAYVVGSTDSAEFPTTPGAFQRGCTFWPPPGALAGHCAPAGFVTKLNASGSGLSYSTKLYGTDLESGGTSASAVAVDDSFDVVVAGSSGAGLPVSVGAFQPVHRGDFDGFVAKLNATGSELHFATYLGGQRSDSPADIALGATGDVYVAGKTRSDDFPTTPGAFQTNCPAVEQVGGCSIAFVAKLGKDGATLAYSTFLGGSGLSIAALQGVSSGANGITVDGPGYAYVTGSAITTDFPTTPGAFKPTTTTRDAFVTKVSLDGTGLVYSTFLGGDTGGTRGFDEGNGIALDSAGNAHVTGATESTDFPILDAVQASYGGGIRDGFVASLNATGSDLLHATYLGGAEQDQGLGIDVDAAGSIYAVGFTESGDFPTAQPSQPALAGQRDAFVAKLGDSGCPDDITDRVRIFRSRIYQVFFTALGLQLVVLKNETGESIQSSLAYVLTDLSNGLLLGARNSTVCLSPSGDPLRVFPAGGDGEIADGESVFALLLFWKTQPERITYWPRVLGGVPAQ